MKTKTYMLLLLGIFSLAIAGCNKDDDSDNTSAPVVKSPVEGKILIEEGTIDLANITVKLYADEALFTGYNKLYVLLYRKGTNELVKNARVRFRPVMDMGTMTHSCPVEDPGAATTSGVFEGAAVFIMESAGMGQWTMNVEVDNLENGQSGEAAFDISVISKEEARLFSFVSEQDGSSIFVSLLQPASAEVGMNDMEITIHYRENMHSFPPLETVQVTVEPEMPTMGHGSPDNVNPVHTANGHYSGKVNLTMGGYWRINLEFRDQEGNLLKDNTYFEITL